MLNQKSNIYIILFAFLLNTSFIYGQDSESNYVVTFTKSSLKPMSEVEDGSGSERKELFEEYAKIMNPLYPTTYNVNEFRSLLDWGINRCIINKCLTIHLQLADKVC
jgi:hypothetical protein